MNLEMYNLEKNLYEWYAKNIPTYGTFNFIPIFAKNKDRQMVHQLWTLKCSYSLKKNPTNGTLKTPKYGTFNFIPIFVKNKDRQMGRYKWYTNYEL